VRILSVVVAAAAPAVLVVTFLLGIGPGLLGVALPPGATRVQLRSRNVPLAMAFVLSWCAVAGALVALLISARRGRPVRNP
jgi:hypothetical protein